jgi:hypothetical protein
MPVTNAPTDEAREQATLRLLAMTVHRLSSHDVIPPARKPCLSRCRDGRSARASDLAPAGDDRAMTVESQRHPAGTQAMPVTMP